jgi:hypothetical protein
MKRLLLFILLGLLVLTGCVERLITVRTQPPGAVVWLNGAEAGMTPVTVPFTWYGNYEVVIRKDGYQTIKTARRADAPFYEWPPLDLVSECLLPFTLTDHHQWDYSLNPQIPTDPNDLINRAITLQSESLIPNP